MMKNKNWKPLSIEGIFTEQNLEGLIGIEELTNYDIEDEIINSKRKPDGKRKQADSDSIKNNKKIKTEPEPNIYETNEEIKTVKVNYVLSPKRLNDSLKSKHNTKKHVFNKVNIKHEVGSKIKENITSVSVDDLTTWRNFGLADELLEAIAEQGFSYPTPIQSLTLPPAILGKRDILGAAETGSGKTLAFGLPIINGILKLKNEPPTEFNNSYLEEEEEIDTNNDIKCVRSINNIKYNNRNRKPLYAVILTPTRELAVQVKNHLVAMTKYTDINVAVVLGGMASVKQERVLEKGPEIIVATPGRLWELIQEGNEHLSQINNIRYLTIDETDRMIERGHFQELHYLLERLNVDEHLKKQRQNFVFSATLTMVHDIPKHLKKKIKHKGKRILKLTPGQKLQKIIEMLGITDPKIIDVTKETGTASSLTECRITCPIEEKDYYLFYFLKKHPGRTLIFCNSIGCVKRLTTLFTILQCDPLCLHAGMQQRQRLKNLERFRDDDNGVLVATDVAARGLDIPKVQHVIHYQVPRTAENYVHRSGRAGRATEEGITVLFMEPTELKSYIRLCSTLGRTKDIPLFPVADEYIRAVKERVNLARTIDVLELQVRRSTAETGWVSKLAEELDLIIDDDEMPARKINCESIEIQKHALVVKRKLLNCLLSKAIFPERFNTKYPTNDNIMEMQQPPQNAIQVMKSALENYQRSRTRIGVLLPKIKKNKNKKK